MKKGILLIILVAGTLLSSCEGPRGPMGPPGPAGSDAYANWETIDCTVRDLDWQTDYDEHGNTFYFYAIDIDDLTPIFNSGTLLAYRYISSNAQQVLPYTRHNEDNYGNVWTETIDYDFTKDGYVTFYVTNSDFNYPTAPGTMYFRVVLMW